MDGNVKNVEKEGKAMLNGDYLNRKEYIDACFEMIVSSFKLPQSVAIGFEGKWGSGKSWILEKLESKLNNDNKYIVFKYNSWENDYYDEPLLGIVSSLCSQINDTFILRKEVKEIFGEKMLKIMKKSFELIESSLSSISKKILGFDLINGVKQSLSYISNEKTEVSQNQFKSIQDDVSNIVEALNTISNYKPIVFIVDELDRCLPEFSIKTLERLHHVFKKVKNSVVIISVDKDQLERTIKNMFGDIPFIGGYLSKFFDFSVKLDDGEMNDIEFQNKYNQLLEAYNIDDQKQIQLVQEFVRKMFDKYTPREKNLIINKILLCHNLSNMDCSKFGIGGLMSEIFLIIMKEGLNGVAYDKPSIYPFVGNQPKYTDSLEYYFKKDFFSSIGKVINASKLQYIVNQKDYKSLVFHVFVRYLYKSEKIYPYQEDLFKGDGFLSSFNDYFDRYYSFYKLL